MNTNESLNPSENTIRNPCEGKVEENFLISLSRETVKSLESIWQEIGLSRIQMDDEIKKLVDEIAQVYKNKLRNEQETKEAYLADVMKYTAEIQVVSETIQETVPQILYDENCGLLAKVGCLQNVLNQLKEKKRERIVTLSALKNEVSELCVLLGESVQDPFIDVFSDLSPNRVDQFQERIRVLSIEKENRVVAVGKLMLECSQLLDELKIHEESPLDQSNRMNDLSMDNIAKLSARIQELQLEKSKRESTLEELGSQINSLWDRLKISEDSRACFFTGVNGIGLDAISACDKELERLIRMKQERLGELIADTRGTIIELWDQMQYSGEARAYFLPHMTCAQDTFTDQTLLIHEEEAQRLQTRLDAMKPLLKYIEKRENIIQERTEFEESLKNPDRLLDRGSGKRDTGRLLREEKLQNRIKKDLPKITEFLKKKIPLWEEEYKMEFCYKGVPYLETIAYVDEAYKILKEEERAEKDRKKKIDLEHEVTWGSSSRRVSMGEKAKSLRGLRTPNSKTRLPMTKELSNLSRTTPNSSMTAMNVCSLSRENDENAGDRLRSSASVSSSNLSTCSFPDED